MGKQILTTLKWTVIFFVTLAVFKYFTVEGYDWIVETLDVCIPTVTGFFIGYGEGRDENR